MFKWFKKDTGVKSLEKELAGLASKVSKHEAALSAYRSSARRYKGVVTLYSVLFYAIYLAIWIAFLARNTQDARRWTFETLPIIGFPLFIYLLRSTISTYYDRRIGNEEVSLETLKAQQKEKIEEFKTKTDFYTTKSLIDRYSGVETTSSSTPNETKRKSASNTPKTSITQQTDTPAQEQRQHQQMFQSPRLTTQSQLTPQRHPQSLIGTVPTPSSLSGSPQISGGREPPKIAEFAPNAEAHHIMQERHWYDRLLDVVIGEDEGSDKSRHRLEETIRTKEEKITGLEMEIIRLQKLVKSSSLEDSERSTRSSDVAGDPTTIPTISANEMTSGSDRSESGTKLRKSGRLANNVESDHK